MNFYRKSASLYLNNKDAVSCHFKNELCSFVTPSDNLRGFLGIGQSCPSATGEAAVVSQ